MTKKYNELATGYSYVFDKLHEQNRKTKNNAFLVLIPFDKNKNPRIFGVSGMNYSEYSINSILNSNLSESTFFYTGTNRRLVVSTNENFYSVFIVTIPKERKNIDNKYIYNAIKNKSPLSVTLKHLEESKNLLTPKDVFRISWQLNSRYSFFIENSYISGNSGTTFNYGIQQPQHIGGNYSIITNSYWDIAYPELSNIINNIYDYRLKSIDKKTLNKILKQAKRLPYKSIQSINYKQKLADDYDLEVKKDSFAKAMKLKEIKEIDWELKFEEYMPAYASFKKEFKNVEFYANFLDSPIDFLDKNIGKDSTRRLIKTIVRIFSNHTQIPTKEIGTSAVALRNINSSIIEYYNQTK